jgi:hypothetical protein
MIRRILAMLSIAATIGIASGPLGCDLLKPPEPPKPPDGLPPPEKGGNCCFRDDRVAPTMCKGRDRCCNGDFDLGACESKGGVWFHTSEGCRGAC